MKATLNIPNPPPGPGQEYFDVFLRATSNAGAGSPVFGTYYAFEIQEPPACPMGPCSGFVTLTEDYSGTITNLGSTSFTFYPGSVFRAVQHGNQIGAYVDNNLIFWTTNSDISTGQPGIGAVEADPSNTISHVELATVYRGTPTMPSVGQIGVTTNATQVSMQWPAATDGTGPGIAFYQILRNGTQIQLTNTTSFTDPTLSPVQNYTYKICAYDFDLNYSCDTVPVTTPPASGPVQERQIGVRPTGSYWGGGGENIDLQSGNLNYTQPILRLKARGNWSVPLNLNYNSLNWRQDSGGTWQLGADVGYGYGWKLMVGSLLSYSTPGGGVAYMFTDPTGAEYLLTQNNAGVYTASEGVYVSYDSNTGELHFNDGSYWVFGCTSSGNEPDAGTQYPTLIEDSNGNQIMITYKDGIGATWTNSSARISNIEEVRGKGTTDYTFTYNRDAIPHLTGITNSIGTSENYSFTYLSNYTLTSPFNGQSYGTVTLLQSSERTGIPATTYFTYDTSSPTAACATSGTGTSGPGELTQLTAPYCAHIRWTYTDAYSLSGTTYNEVQDRYLSTASGASETLIQLVRTDDSGYQVHSSATLDDSPANAEKYWTFQTDTAQFNSALRLNYEERTLSTHTPLVHLDFTWAQTPTTLNPYIGTIVTKLNPGQTYEADKQTVQSLDQYGNVVQTQMYNFGAGAVGSLARTYTNTYLTGTHYTSRYIVNRLQTSTVTDGTNSTTLVSNSFDGTSIATVAGLYEHDDPNYPASFTYRGNVTSSTTPSASVTNYYDMAGNLTSTTRNGVTTGLSTTSATNYAAPEQLTTNSLSSSAGWSTFLGIQSETGPNGDNAHITYDGQARPAHSKSKFGVVTYYTYNDTASPPNMVATTNSHWVQTAMDGLGRTIQSNTGYNSTTVSKMDTTYIPVACSAFGSRNQISQPYAPGGSDAWTVYNYDASGRTINVVQPDGSTTSYVYQGNNVIVYDPAGNWKEFTMDALGNLATVWEPDPALGTVSTNYAYDILNHLTSVSMPRGANTQTRTFNYNVGTTVTAFLQSATNPETGTVTYTYNSNNLLASKTDAKGQNFTYQYDSYNRRTSITWTNAPGGAQVLRTLIYDTNSLDGTFSGSYTQGRLVAVQNAQFTSGTGTKPSSVELTEMYAYTQAGETSGKRLQVNEQYPTGLYTKNLDTLYTY